MVAAKLMVTDEKTGGGFEDFSKAIDLFAFGGVRGGRKRGREGERKREKEREKERKREEKERKKKREREKKPGVPSG